MNTLVKNETLMKTPIKTNPWLCTGCSRCFRVCPMETANIKYKDNYGNTKIKVDRQKCITCGRCVKACPHEARFYTDDTDLFFEDLANGAPISMVASPSLQENIPQYKRLFTFLKQRNVNKIFDISYGVDLSLISHIKYSVENPTKPLIAQPCATVISYCQKYRHDLLPKLSPIHSPMTCTAIYLKKYLGISDNIAALTPCIAKTDELCRTGEIHYNITYSKIMEYIERNNIMLPKEETDFDRDGSLFDEFPPLPESFKETLDFLLEKSLKIDRITGNSVYSHLNTYAETSDGLLPEFLEAMSCEDGCRRGSGSMASTNIFEMNRQLDSKWESVIGSQKKENFESLCKSYDEKYKLADFITSYEPVDINGVEVSEEDIRHSFKLLGKDSEEKQNLNCDACGSDTCLKMARRIALGSASPTDCIVNVFEEIETAHAIQLHASEQLAKMEKMQNSNERVRAMYDATPLSIHFWDKDLNLYDCNLETLNMFNLESKENFIRDFPKYSPKYQPDGELSERKAFNHIMRAFETGFQRFEFMHITEDGKSLPTEITLVNLKHNAEDIVVAYVRDLREYKKMMHDIEERDALLDAVVKNYSGIIFCINKDRIITLFRGLHLEQIGLNPATIEGKDIGVAADMWGNFNVIENVEKTFSEGSQEWFAEVNGKNFQARTSPVYGENGEVTDIVGCINDLTELIMLKDQLEVALEKAEDANKAKSTFLSNMSHEIRTPMNAIIGMTSIGKDAKENGKKDYCFDKIDVASRHLLGVINDILDLSKIEAGKFELSPSQITLEKILQRVVTVNKYRIDEKKQNFMLHLDTAIPKILIDDQRLTQVITNLLSNAVKFTPESGEISIDTRLVSETDGICTVEVRVKDSGIGISPEQQSKLFQSFQQAETSTAKKFGGTGLGLAISKNIVEMMDGEIWIESELGRGATFAFTVKAQKVSEKRSLPDWRNIRILAVDDDSSTLEYMEEILRSLGAACDVARSGEEALLMVEQGKDYTVYFVDQCMPGMSGTELTAVLKERNSKSAVVLMSAVELGVLNCEIGKFGVDKFITKPLFPSTVADAINELIGIKDEEVQEDVADEFSGHCILIAEDVEINREIVMALLEATLVEIHCAEDGVEAVQMFRENPNKYEMIFMDVQMPNMNGYEATQTIRELDADRAKDIPIIAMTANVFKEDIEKCLASGMNGHVGKPLNLDEILTVLREYLVKH